MARSKEEKWSRERLKAYSSYIQSFLCRRFRLSVADHQELLQDFRSAPTESQTPHHLGTREPFSLAPDTTQ